MSEKIELALSLLSLFIGEEIDAVCEAALGKRVVSEAVKGLEALGIDAKSLI